MSRINLAKSFDPEVRARREREAQFASLDSMLKDLSAIPQFTGGLHEENGVFFAEFRIVDICSYVNDAIKGADTETRFYEEKFFRSAHELEPEIAYLTAYRDRHHRLTHESRGEERAAYARLAKILTSHINSLEAGLKAVSAARRNGLTDAVKTTTSSLRPQDI